MNTKDIKNDKITYDEATDIMTIDAASSAAKGHVRSIASKSHAHRLLIAAALSDSETRILTPDTSKDIEATIDCLNSLGAGIKRKNDYIAVTPISLNQESPKAVADCGESGSTLRFILPVIGALGISTEITMHGRLSERPLSPMYEELISHGMYISPQGTNPLSVSGRLTAGDYTIAGNVSSQFVTGLLFALPIASTAGTADESTKSESILHVTGRLESRPYVDITLDVLKKSGIIITEKTLENGDTCFIIPSNQTYHTDPETLVDGDWSNAAFFLAAGAISDTVTVTGLNMNSLQGDKKVLDILKSFGADITMSDKKSEAAEDYRDITITPAPLHATDIDASDIPDLVPILAVVAAVADGITSIRNIERLRIKESDRVQTVINTLSSLGADIYEEMNSIIINGKISLSGGIIDSCNDHRIAMAAGIAALRCEDKVQIKNPRAVNKSYPGFYKDLAKLL